MNETPKIIRPLIKFWTYYTPTMPYTPDNLAVSQILIKIDAMLAQIDSNSAHAARISQVTSILSALKARQAGQTIEDLPMKDGVLNAVEWEKKSKTDQHKTWATLTEIQKELRCLNATVLKCGTLCFGIFSALLVLIVSAYLCIHRAEVRTSLYTSLTSKQSFEILKEVHLIELQLAALKETRNRKPVESPSPSQPTPAKQSINATKATPSAETTRTETQTPTDSKPAPDQSDIKIQFATLTTNLTSISLPHETISLLGTASAELEAEDLTIHLTYQQFLKHLRADLESLSTAYFWTIQPWRWVELSLWATMGCLVGLLFYIASLLKQGVFQPEEIPMFGAELLMAPIVVPVIFFLFNMSGISEFTPSQSSITMNIGVAFILGFAIRRTIGIIDLIKKRILPDPASS